jgi:thiazole synthase
MNLMVNGEPATTPEGSTVADLLDRMGLPARGIAVERNREIVPKSAYGVTPLTDGDRIEIVQFVGGG